MGLLDLPLVSEMETLEKKARRGDEEALLQYLYGNLPTIKRVYVDRLTRNEGKTMREALEKAGVAVVCVR